MCCISLSLVFLADLVQSDIFKNRPLRAVKVDVFLTNLMNLLPLEPNLPLELNLKTTDAIQWNISYLSVNVQHNYFVVTHEKKYCNWKNTGRFPLLCRKRTAQLSEDLAITISINIQIWLHKLNNDNWMDLKERTTEINRKSSSSDKLLTVSIK